MFGEQICFTDGAENSLRLTEENLRSNHAIQVSQRALVNTLAPECPKQVRMLDWDLFHRGDEQDFGKQRGCYDVILGAELLYYRTCVDALLHCCAALIAPKG